MGSIVNAAAIVAGGLVGQVAGELADIDGKLERFGVWLRRADSVSDDEGEEVSRRA